MKIEEQVCSLELAKRLKGLGVKQESLFVWYIKMQVPFVNYLPTIARDQEDDELACAFTVAELGEMLPILFNTHRKVDGWICFPIDFMVYPEVMFRSGDTEADARAKMLIHLIEKGIVKP